MTEKTLMRREIEEIPQATRRLLEQGLAERAIAGEALRALDPHCIVTVARGSSDHAATYLKYAIELAAGVPVASVGPSVASIYGAQLRLGGMGCIGISQSGRSPDIVELLRAAKTGGALTCAITNDGASPMAEAADHSLALRAGPERSVAATKSFVTSIVAGLSLLAEWRQDAALGTALAGLPDVFERAISCDWTPLSDRLVRSQSLYVLGRGPGFAIANEMALKFKETSGLHAESFSAAEVLHGPAAIVQAGFPVLALAVEDAALDRLEATAERLVAQGADVFLTAPGKTAGAVILPSVSGLHPLVAPLVPVVSFYAFVEALSRRRGFHPDTPPHLRKVTETV
ncbi:SIS domain-containing protein [Thioclava sp. 15-R06ZXC-3]|uniref:SIS domain-containing protein n=1 Tax=Thioclava arctica TaxID=3238301 RepID=A0ABV3TLN1_9RHOB